MLVRGATAEELWKIKEAVKSFALHIIHWNTGKESGKDLLFYQPEDLFLRREKKVN